MSEVEKSGEKSTSAPKSIIKLVERSDEKFGHQDHKGTVESTVAEKGAVYDLSHQRQQYRRNVPPFSLLSSNGEKDDDGGTNSLSAKESVAALKSKVAHHSTTTHGQTLNSLHDADKAAVGAFSVTPLPSHLSRGEDDGSVTSIDDLIALALLNSAYTSEVVGSGSMSLPPLQEEVVSSTQQSVQRNVSEAQLEREQTMAVSAGLSSGSYLETHASAVHVSSAHLVVANPDHQPAGSDDGTNDVESQMNQRTVVLAAPLVENKWGKKAIWALELLVIVLAAVLGTYFAMRQRTGDSGNEDAESLVPTPAPVPTRNVSLSLLGSDLLIEEHELTSISLSEDGVVLAVGSALGSASVYELQPNDDEWVLRDHKGIPAEDGRSFRVTVDLSSNGSRCVLSIPDSPSAEESVGHLLEWNEDESVYETLDFGGSRPSSPDLAAAISSDGAYGVYGSRRDCFLDVAGFYTGENETASPLTSYLDCEDDTQTPTSVPVGWSLDTSSDGSILVVGSPNADETLGSVKVLKRKREGWSEAGPALTGVSPGDQYGYSVSTANNKASDFAVGSPGFENDLGFVGVYRRIKKGWEAVGGPIIGTEAGGRLGLSVSLSSDGLSLAVASSTKVRVFRWFGQDWEQVGLDLNADSSLSTTSGIQVSFGGNNFLAVGFPIASGPSALVRVYKLDDGTA